MAFDAGTILARLGLDTEDIDKALITLGKKSAAVGAGLTAVGAGLTAGITLPIFDMGRAALKAAAEAEETENLFRVSFGKMASQAENWAARTSDALGLNEFELKRQSGTIFLMAANMGIAEQQAFEMATSMTELAANMASLRNIGIDEAFAKLKSGIAGQSEPLRELGIVVLENTVAQTAFAKSILATGRDLSEGEKVWARWQAILEQTSADQGDLVRTFDSVTNTVRRFGERMNELAARLGQALLPFFEKLVRLLDPLAAGLEKLVTLFAEAPIWVRALTVAFVGLAAAIGPVIVAAGTLTVAFGALSASVGFLGFASVTAALVALKGALISAAVAAAGFTGSVLLPVAAFATLGVAIGAGIFKLAEFVGVIDTLEEAVKKKLAVLPPTAQQIEAVRLASQLAGREGLTWAEATRVLADHQKKLQQESLGTAGAIATQTKSIQQQVREMLAAEKEHDELARAAAAVGLEVEDLDKALAKEILSQLDAAEAVKKHARELAVQQNIIREGVVQYEALARATRSATQALVDVSTRDEVSRAQIELNKHLEEAARRWRDIQIEAERTAQIVKAKVPEIIPRRLEEDAEEALNRYRLSLSQTADLMQALGPLAETSIGRMIAALMNARAAALGLQASWEQVKVGFDLGNFDQVLAGLTTGIGSVMQGFSAFMAATDKKGIAGILGGAAVGAQIGSAFGPIGSAIGAGAGALAAGLRKLLGGGPNLIRDAARDLGASLTQELADSIRKSGQPLQLAVADIFRAGGFQSVDIFAREVGDIFSGLERGEFAKPQAIAALEAAVPMLIQNLGKLGPAGEAEVQRIIAAAQRLNVEFQGLDELIQSTFAPATLEELAAQFGKSNDEIREMADRLGIDVQTNLERMAAELGLTASEFQNLGAALEREFGIPAEQLASFLEATGLTAADLATTLGIDVGAGAELVALQAEAANAELLRGVEFSSAMADELERAARALSGFHFPAMADSLIPARGAQHGFSGLVGGPIGPVPFITGEGGFERVTVEPLGGRSQGHGDAMEGRSVVLNSTVQVNLPAGSDREQAQRIAVLLERNVGQLLTRAKNVGL